MNSWYGMTFKQGGGSTRTVPTPKIFEGLRPDRLSLFRTENRPLLGVRMNSWYVINFRERGGRQGPSPRTRSMNKDHLSDICDKNRLLLEMSMNVWYEINFWEGGARPSPFPRPRFSNAFVQVVFLLYVQRIGHPYKLLVSN